MPRPRPAFIVYLLGVALLGSVFYWAEAAVGETAFFVLALVYIVVLRLVAEGIERSIRARSQRQSGENDA